MDTKRWHNLLTRSLDTNKYDYGHILIIGGSEAMVGAPVLAGRAALRVGAGLVTIASTSETVKLIDRDIEEVMTLALPPWSKINESIDVIKTFIKKRQVSVLIIGSGLPADADEMILTLLSKVNLPLLLDAEAFTALSDHLSLLQSATSADIIITPHLGEYARLIKNEPQYHIDNGRAALEEFAYDHNVTLVLKRHHTLIVSSEGEIYENTTGNPALATAGTGDVLAGIIAGLLAQGIKPYEAARMGTYLHGLAGDMATESNTEPGVIASDIIEFLPKALKKLEHLNQHND